MMEKGHPQSIEKGFKERTVDLYSDDLFKSHLRGIRKSPWVEEGRPWYKWYESTAPRLIDYPEVPLYEICDQAALKFPNNTFVIYTKDGRKYIYLELKYYTDKLAAALYDKFGIGKGKSIALLMWNSPEYIFSCFGVLKTGACCTPINPLLTRDDVSYIIDNAEIIDTVIVEDRLYPLIRGIDKIRNVIVVGRKMEGAYEFWELIEAYRPDQRPEVEIDPKENLALLMYTGGTTGRPKGVMLTHFNLLANALQCTYTGRDLEKVRSGFGKGRTLIALPICHIYGFTMVMYSIYQGAMMILMERFDIREFCENVEKYQVHYFPGAPTMYVYLVNYPEISKYNFSSLVSAISGSAPLPPEVARKWEELTGVPACMGYGLTECSPVTTVNPVWVFGTVKRESIGIPLIDTDCKIVDLETGEEVPLGEVGEILWRGPQVMKGYWKAPEMTREVLTEDGWVRSGDLAYMDEDGFIYIVGRVKDIIKYKGYRLLPDEIEAKLYEHPAVMECAVIGVPDPVAGENIKAFIVLKPEYRGKISEEEILEWAKEKLGPLKHPRIIEFRSSLPKTPVGKIFRRKLREEEYEKAKQK